MGPIVDGAERFVQRGEKKERKKRKKSEKKGENVYLFLSFSLSFFFFFFFSERLVGKGFSFFLFCFL